MHNAPGRFAGAGRVVCSVSIAAARETLAWALSANRAVRDHTEQHYLPAASRARAADQGALGVRIVNWRRTLEQKWPCLRFGQIKAETAVEQHAFELELHLNELNPNAVRAEIYADEDNDHDPLRKEMAQIRQLTGPTKSCVYRATLPATRPVTDYTPRIIPQFSGVVVPLKAGQILWQK